MLPIGGVKEKCIAAHRSGIKVVILPAKNKKDVAEIPKDVRKDLKIHYVEEIEQVLEIALEKTIDVDFVKN